jgi:hypothetical protein
VIRGARILRYPCIERARIRVTIMQAPASQVAASLPRPSAGSPLAEPSRQRGRPPSAGFPPVFLLCALALTVGLPVRAQEPLVIPRLSGPVALDGRPDEPAWEGALALPMTMHTPTFGGAPSERTEVLVGHDGSALYLACRLYDADASDIRATSLRRDDGALSNDWCVVNLDTFADRENALIFGVTPAGVRTDLAFTESAGSLNFDWNVLWGAAASRGPEGWFAEIQIPFSSLRFSDEAGTVTMGLAVWRNLARKNEIASFPAIPPDWGFNSILLPSQMHPVVLHGVRARRTLYAVPYALVGGGLDHALTPDRTAYASSTSTLRDVGGEVKYGITPNLTLDLTLNTDFAQVEADDQQVNLSRFSLFFPEKRQFFQERASVFNVTTGGDDRLFYSRRIGLAGGQPVPLYGGARLVGRVGAWDVGLLDMQTQAVDGLASENLGVFRLRRSVLNANSTAGVLLTSRRGGDANTLVGLDGLFHLGGEDYLALNLAQTFTDGEPEGTDGAARTLGRVRWERRGSEGFRFQLEAARVGVAFDPRLGFIRRHDYLRIGEQVTYGWRPGASSPVFRHRIFVPWSAYLRNEDGSAESVEVVPRWVVAMKDGREFTAGLHGYHESLRQGFSLADGVGVLPGEYRFGGVNVAYAPSVATPLRSGAQARVGTFYDGWRAMAGVSPTWNVSRHLELGGAYELNRIVFGERGEAVTAHVGRVRVRAYLDTRLSGAAFVQYNSVAHGASVNLRLRYNPREGEDLYLVYNEGINTERYAFLPARPFTDARTVMAKYVRTFRLTF